MLRMRFEVLLMKFRKLLCMLWVVWVMLVCRFVTKVVGVTLSTLVVKSWGARICGILFGTAAAGHVRHRLVSDSMMGTLVCDLDSQGL